MTKHILRLLIYDLVVDKAAKKIISIYKMFI